MLVDVALFRHGVPESSGLIVACAMVKTWHSIWVVAIWLFVEILMLGFCDFAICMVVWSSETWGIGVIGVPVLFWSRTWSFFRKFQVSNLSIQGLTYMGVSWCVCIHGRYPYYKLKQSKIVMFNLWENDKNHHWILRYCTLFSDKAMSGTQLLPMAPIFQDAKCWAAPPFPGPAQLAGLLKK